MITFIPLIVMVATLLTFTIGYTNILTPLAATVPSPDTNIYTSDMTSSNNTHDTPFELSYDTQNMTHRSAVEEWQPQHFDLQDASLQRFMEL